MLTNKPAPFSFKLKPSVLSIQSILITAALNVNTLTSPAIAADTPSFRSLPAHGLPFNEPFINTEVERLNSYPFESNQLVDIDNDGDLDLIRAETIYKQRAFLTINAGNGVAPAVQKEQFLGDANFRITQYLF